MNKIYLKKIIITLIIFIFLILTTLAGQAQQEVLNKDCSMNWDIFNRDWHKYSDIDEKLSFAELSLSSRSPETQKYYTTQETLVDLKLQIYFLKRDMEIDAQMRREMRGFKNRLVKGLQLNLLKSFWRLAYITYDTIKTGKGLGSSYSKLFTTAEVIPKIGASLKALKGLTPKDSKLAINTKDTTGKIKAVSVTGALQAVETLADPTDTAMTVCNEMTKQILPKADLTEEEIKILQDQHLNNRIITQILEESYRVNTERLKQVEELEGKVKQLEQELVRWEAEEKQRVADMLIDNCKKNLQKAAKEVEPDEEEVIQYGEAECPPPPEGFSFLPLGEESGRYLDEEFVLSFLGILPESACYYELRNIAPEFPYFVMDNIYANLLIWPFHSVSEAEEEFTSLIEKGKSEYDGRERILDDTENRFVVEYTERMKETASDGTIDGEKYTYNRSLYVILGVMFDKNYVFVIAIGTDTPVSVEAKAITASKSALNELEKNTKLLLSN
jgi:hypothetical protein